MAEEKSPYPTKSNENYAAKQRKDKPALQDYREEPQLVKNPERPSDVGNK